MLNHPYQKFERQWNAASNEAQLPICTLCGLHHLKPGSRKDIEWGSSWSLVGSLIQLTVVRAVFCHFSYDSPGSASQLSAFLGHDFRTKPQYRALAGGKAPPVAAVYTLCVTDLDVSPLALREQPYKLTASITVDVWDMADYSLASCLARPDRSSMVVRGRSRTVSDDMATPLLRIARPSH